MDKYDIIEMIAFLLLITIPITYYFATVTFYYDLRPEKYQTHKFQVNQAIEETDNLSRKYVLENTSMTYFRFVKIYRKIRAERIEKFKEEARKPNYSKHLDYDNNYNYNDYIENSD